MTAPLVVVGAAGTGRAIADAASLAGREVLGFLDDDPALRDTTVLGLPVLGPMGSWVDHAGAEFVDGLGSPHSFRRREQLYAGIGIPRERFATLVHPHATVSVHASVGRGCVVLARAVVAPLARLDERVTVLEGAIVNHDTVVGAWSILAAGANLAGDVTVGRASYIGASAVVRNGVTVGSGSLVGMGAVVVRPVGDGETVVGVPAAAMRREERP